MVRYTYSWREFVKELYYSHMVRLRNDFCVKFEGSIMNIKNFKALFENL